MRTWIAFILLPTRTSWCGGKGGRRDGGRDRKGEEKTVREGGRKDIGSATREGAQGIEKSPNL